MEIEFDRLMDALPGLVWTALCDGQAEFFNQRWSKYTGMLLGEAIGSGWLSAVHPDDLSHLLSQWASILASDQASELEARLRRHDGVYRWFKFSVSPVADVSGRIVRWCWINTDIEERRKNEAALRVSERSLRQIINTLPTMAWATEPEGHVDFLNDRWLDYAGFTAEQGAGLGWGAAIHPDDAPGLFAYWQSALETGTPVDTEARMRRFDGEYRWFLFRANPLRDENGTIVKWFGANIDIEDRKRADEALRVSERSLRQIINTLPTTAWATDPEGHVEFLSDRWLDYAGFTAEQGAGLGWGAVIHPDDAPGLFAYWQSCLEAGTAADTEARMRRFDGEYRWFLFRANPLRDANGTITKWYGTNIDIEDRKRADEALLASEHNLKLTINTIPTAAWSAQADGHADFLSDTYLEYAGVASVKVEGWGWRDIIHPDDLDALEAHWKACLETGAAVDTEARLRRFDGEYRWFLFRANPLRDANGAIVKWYGHNTDIEDRKHAEALLAGENQQARTELAHVARVATLNAMAASIAHEVSQPLSGILSNASACVRMLATDPPNLVNAAETARRTIRDANRATEVIKRLRAMFSARAPSKESLDVNDVAREVIALSASELRRSRALIRASFGNGLPLVSADRVQLQQVILNLLLNAADAMAEVNDRPRMLLIETDLDSDSGVKFTVRDSGTGIDIQNVEKLFEAFYTTKSKGMGVGLSICRSIIESHGGRLWAASNDGPGATFAFSIPSGLRAAMTPGLGTPFSKA
jgi:PAS domain S-box-containing protein